MGGRSEEEEIQKQNRRGAVQGSPKGRVLFSHRVWTCSPCDRRGDAHRPADPGKEKHLRQNARTRQAYCEKGGITNHHDGVATTVGQRIQRTMDCWAYPLTKHMGWSLTRRSQLLPDAISYGTRFVSSNKMCNVGNPSCRYCEAAIDDTEHTFFQCDRWEAPRSRLETKVGHLTPNNVIGVMLERKEFWEAIFAFVETTLR